MMFLLELCLRGTGWGTLLKLEAEREHRLHQQLELGIMASCHVFSRQIERPPHLLCWHNCLS